MDIVIETPARSNVKYTYDKNHQAFRLKKALAHGLSFPFDFGFIPHTIADDGDPLDVMVLSEFPTFTGCIVDVKMIGCILVEQGTGEHLITNHRFLAVAAISRQFEHIDSMEELPEELLRQLEQFFISYITAEGKELRITGQLNAAQAVALSERYSKKTSATGTVAGIPLRKSL
ncbi:inorganic diphosphatase [Nostoc ellipsosporum NOK]|nr:inorganic diphosphatase [Nostoc ellipsosporum NOK]